RHARALRDVGGQCNIIIVLERLHHFLECPNPTFAVEGTAMVAGAADGADAKPLDGDRVGLAVAVPGDQDLGQVGGLVVYEWRQEMLAVPEGKYRRYLRFDPLVNVGRIERELIGPPDQTQIFGRQKPDGTLKPAASQRIAKQSFQRAGFGSLEISWPGSS